MSNCFEKIKKKIPQIIYAFWLIVVLVPLLIWWLAPKVNSEISADGLLGYIIQALSAFGTISLAYVAIWQNEKYKEENDKRLDQQYKEQMIRENLMSEHPQLMIEKVELCSPFGLEVREEFKKDEHQDNCFIGSSLDGVLKITVRNIGNGLLLNMFHEGVNGFWASGNSKTIPIQGTGKILFDVNQCFSSGNDNYPIKYENMRCFQYRQNIKIIEENKEHFNLESDCDGNPDYDTAEYIGTETTVYVILENHQTTVGFTEETTNRKNADRIGGFGGAEN